MGWFAVLLIAGCAKPLSNQPSPHVLRGRVRLVGPEIAADGRFQRSRVVQDADGVPVELIFGGRGGRVVAKTSTVAGEYRFDGLAPGGYAVRTAVYGPVSGQTRTLTIATADVVSLDTLVLASSGDLYPTPNPVGSATVITFALMDTQAVFLRVLDLNGVVVRTLLGGGQLIAGMHAVVWDGLDQAGVRRPDALYWLVLESNDDLRAQLLFR
jgi:hypothetical protein